MPNQTAKHGVIFALAAYIMWGIAPVYFKSLTEVPAYEILAHRVVWSCLFITVLLGVGKQWSAVSAVIKRPKQLATLALTSVLIGINWLIFIWAVNNDRMLDASLGYYINPLFNVILGMLFLGERFRRAQWAAIGLALIGVLIQVISYGSLPWIAMSLAVSFGIYGLLRKKVNLGALPGLFVETLWLLPLAAAYLWIFADSPTSHLTHNSTGLNVLLLSAGIVTTLPLLCFAAAATRLRLSTIGFFQYIGPSLMFMLATSVYGEELEPMKLLTFAFIWVGLGVFTWDALRNQRKQRQQKKAAQ
ncbi:MULTISPECIES: EamA family transporter RarD [unclassified Agarivorans]|uniref:EamA family transporter RarD n=1 Tax=unclassified Agarivorans TaxID=2636026 RepID=UPI0026E3CC7A|nr:MULTISPECIES: EamA family transporter RarD [unclassified Agarivorans]MDO6685650.1 EamA family transporter RarD [Agarivorans sp. 3_MG-2023]MDO6716235.1 EamA family transporter RarD [Agarivorans sp. 2_MG-2023]